MTHDIDEQDKLISDEMSNVNWHAVDQKIAARFCLALGLYRDHLNDYEKKIFAWTACAYLTISVYAITLFAAFFELLNFAAIIVIICQAIGALLLYCDAMRAMKHVNDMQSQAIKIVKEIALIHPSNSK